MTDFTAIGQLVIKGQELLDSIKGGAISEMKTKFEAVRNKLLNDSKTALADFATKSNAKIAEQDKALRDAVAPVLDNIPIIALTKNQVMLVNGAAANVGHSKNPDNFIVNGGVTFRAYASISSSPQSRSVGDIKILEEMELGVKGEYPDFNIRKSDHYKNGFSIFRIEWDLGADFDGEWLFYPRAFGSSSRLGLSSLASAASFVKLESGSVSGFLADGAVANAGNWCFSKRKINSVWFGSYTNPHPSAKSQKGSMLIALPICSTGNVDHPKKIFSAVEVF